MKDGRLVVVDLCAGTGSSTQAFRDRGHIVVSLELKPDETGTPAPFIAGDIRHYATRTAWIAALAAHGLTIEDVDVAWASPPCTVFSSAGKTQRWKHTLRDDNTVTPFYGPREPLDPAAVEGCWYVMACLAAIDALSPRWWWLENPQGGLFTMGFMAGVPGPTIVTYCQYEDTRMKPTGLWGIHPPSWEPRPRCRNGDPCHEAAPRRSRTGTQGIKNAKERGIVPYALSESIAVACESTPNQP